MLLFLGWASVWPFSKTCTRDSPFQYRNIFLFFRQSFQSQPHLYPALWNHITPWAVPRTGPNSGKYDHAHESSLLQSRYSFNPACLALITPSASSWTSFQSGENSMLSKKKVDSSFQGNTIHQQQDFFKVSKRKFVDFAIFFKIIRQLFEPVRISRCWQWNVSMFSNRTLLV